MLEVYLALVHAYIYSSSLPLITKDKILYLYIKGCAWNLLKYPLLFLVFVNLFH